MERVGSSHRPLTFILVSYLFFGPEGRKLLLLLLYLPTNTPYSLLLEKGKVLHHARHPPEQGLRYLDSHQILPAGFLG